MRSRINKNQIISPQKMHREGIHPTNIVQAENITAKGRAGIGRMARRIREHLVVIRNVYDAPDPLNTPLHIERQLDIIAQLKAKHLLPEDPEDKDRAAREFIESGEAKFYNRCVCLKKRIKQLIKKLIGLNGTKVL